MKFNWNFPKANLGNQQGNRADISLFDKPGGIVHTVVRETIQNSLDAKKDASITMEFRVHKIPKSLIPDFDTLQAHFKAIVKSEDNFSQNIKGILKESLDYIATQSAIEVLEVSDYETTGLGGVNFLGDVNKLTNKSQKAWTRLLFQTGIQERDGLAGGSYGFGKLACFGMSQLNTVFYSTLNEAGEFGFIGKSIIPDHKFDSENKTSPGFWCSESSDETLPPIGETRSDRVPEIFRRKQIGTSIFILCPKYEEGLNLNDLLIQAVLMNYYPALNSGLLCARIVNANNKVQEISKSSLNDETFLAALEKNDFESFIRLKCITQSFVEREIPLLGKCRFYIFECEPKSRSGMRKVECFRLNGQVVHKFSRRRPNLFKSFIAVFECVDQNGNQILALAENETHDTWDREAFDRTKKEITVKTGKSISFSQVKKSYDDFINECLDAKYDAGFLAKDGILKTFSAGKGNSQIIRNKVDISTKQGTFAIFRGSSEGKNAEVPRVDVSLPGDSSGVPIKNDVPKFTGEEEKRVGAQEPSTSDAGDTSPSDSPAKTETNNGLNSENSFENRPDGNNSGTDANGSIENPTNRSRSTVTKKSSKNKKKSNPDLSGKSGRKNSEKMVRDEIRIIPALIGTFEDSFTYKIVILTKARGIVSLNFFAIFGSDEEKIEDIEVVKNDYFLDDSPFRIKISSDVTAFEIKTNSYYQLSVKGDK